MRGRSSRAHSAVLSRPLLNPWLSASTRFSWRYSPKTSPMNGYTCLCSSFGFARTRPRAFVFLSRFFRVDVMAVCDIRTAHGVSRLCERIVRDFECHYHFAVSGSLRGVPSRGRPNFSRGRDYAPRVAAFFASALASGRTGRGLLEASGSAGSELQQAGRGLMRRDRGWGNTSDYRVRLAVSTRPLRASTSPRKSPSKSVVRTAAKTSARGLRLRNPCRKKGDD